MQVCPAPFPLPSPLPDPFPDLLPSSGISEYPLVANKEPSNGSPGENPNDHIGCGMWHLNGCREVCTNGWYQPIMFNRKAMERMAVSSSAYGLTATCAAFDVSQDVGLGPYVWIMQLVHIMWPGVEVNGNHEGLKAFKPTHQAVHCVRHTEEDNCYKPQNWPDHLRYNQQVAIGCGDLNTPSPWHDGNKGLADMYDAYHYFQEHGVTVDTFNATHDFFPVPVLMHPTPTLDGKVRIKKVLLKTDVDAQGLYQGEKVEYRTIPWMNPLPGFSETGFSKQHDLTKKWANFTMADCIIPGTVQKRI